MSTLAADKTVADPPWTAALPIPIAGNLRKAMQRAIAILVADRAFHRAQAELLALGYGPRSQRDRIGADRPDPQAQEWRAAAALADHLNGK